MRPGKTLALVGGDVVLESGILTATGGRIELGSVAGNGRVSLNPTINGLTLGYEGISSFDNVNLSQQSLLNISGLISGDVKIQGDRVTFQDSAIFAATNSGDGGEIFIQSQQLNISDRSSIGSIALGGGKSNDVTLQTRNLTVQDAFIGSLSIGRGQTGNLRVEATDITLIRTAANLFLPTGIFAVTGGSQTGAFGNIQLRSQFLFLRRGSQIVTDAQGTATGGNIDIDSQFIIAVPSENSDIIADAIRGRGGNVQITTEGIFGIEFREEETPLSDITVSSQFGVDGNVQIDNPNVDPSRIKKFVNKFTFFITF